jgi:hypothetical protein
MSPSDIGDSAASFRGLMDPYNFNRLEEAFAARDAEIARLRSRLDAGSRAGREGWKPHGKGLHEDRDRDAPGVRRPR